MGTPAVQFLFITISLYLAVQILRSCTFRDRIFYRVCMGDTPSWSGHMTLNNFRFQPPLVRNGNGNFFLTCTVAQYPAGPPIRIRVNEANSIR